MSGCSQVGEAGADAVRGSKCRGGGSFTSGNTPACLLPLNACLLATPNCLRACLAAAPHCVPAWMQGITVKVQPGAKPYGVSELSYTGTTPDGTSPYTLVGAGGTSPRYLSSGTLVVVP